MINGELIVDNFAGGGGASDGIRMATGVEVDIAINHDPKAIAMHKANHPKTKHYCESVWDVDPVKACEGHPVALAWFSPDCKHFSKAKGGKPKDKNIRGLAWVALRWAAKVRPRVIMLENVEEFQTWGPLNRSHHPIKSKTGFTFRKFLKQLEELGYQTDCRILTAADYGTPTMRKRFFMIARCDGKPIVWPEPTHAPRTSESVKSGLMKPYVGTYTKVDFSMPCPSIFDTKEKIKEKYGIRAQRPLADKTLQRIARGFRKFILESPEPFIVTVNHGGERAPRDIKDPMATITGKHGFGIVDPYMVKLESEEIFKKHKIKNVVCASYLMQQQGKSTGCDLKEPIRTMTGVNHMAEIRAFMVKYSDVEPDDIKHYGIVEIKGIKYLVIDIGLRMLEPKELYGCQGFSENYIIDRDFLGKKYPRSEQVRRCGNAVCPPLPAALVRANLPELCNYELSRKSA